MRLSIHRTAAAAALALVVAAAALAGTGLAAGRQGHTLADRGDDGRGGDGRLALAVYGDAPYGTSNSDFAQFNATPAFIQTINADRDVSLVLHVGDIHSGKQSCTRAYDEAIFSMWKAFADPLVYTPGDNEWTDCNKSGESGGSFNAATGKIDYVTDANGNPVDFANGNPAANLLLIRSIFFSHPGTTLGARAMRVISQADAFDPAYPADAAFAENVMWEKGNVLFVTVNTPGGSNNDQDVWYGAPVQSADQVREIAERTGATQRWLDAAFAKAKAEHVAGVVVATQADMWDPEKGAAHQAGYEPIIKTLADDTIAFGKPVLMFNGDSHVYRSDNPLSPSAGCTWESAAPCVSDYPIHAGLGYDVPNFHRVVVHGSTAPLEWLKLTIDPRQHGADDATHFGPFSWTRQTQQLP